MLEVFDFARKVARHYTNRVGPTGTGKELGATHPMSLVTQQPLAVCNCSAMVDTPGHPTFLTGAQVLGIGRTGLYRYLKRDPAEQGLQTKLRGAAAAGSVRV